MENVPIDVALNITIAAALILVFLTAASYWLESRIILKYITHVLPPVGESGSVVQIDIDTAGGDVTPSDFNTPLAIHFPDGTELIPASLTVPEWVSARIERNRIVIRPLVVEKGERFSLRVGLGSDEVEASDIRVRGDINNQHIALQQADQKVADKMLYRWVNIFVWSYFIFVLFVDPDPAFWFMFWGLGLYAVGLVFSIVRRLRHTHIPRLYRMRHGGSSITPT